MVRSTELAAALAELHNSDGTLRPRRFGYFRAHVDPDAEVFVSWAPADPAVKPVVAKLRMDMTIREAIESLGDDDLASIAWLFRGTS